MLENHVDGWNFYRYIPEPKLQTVLFRNAVEAPRVVVRVSWEVANFLHPLSTPGSRIKKRHYPKGLISGNVQPLQQILSGNHFRCVALIRVEQEVDLGQQRFLQTVGGAPVHEVSALVL